MAFVHRSQCCNQLLNFIPLISIRYNGSCALFDAPVAPIAAFVDERGIFTCGMMVSSIQTHCG